MRIDELKLNDRKDIIDLEAVVWALNSYAHQYSRIVGFGQDKDSYVLRSDGRLRTIELGGNVVWESESLAETFSKITPE